MITSRKCVTRWMFVSLSSLILILLLAACGGDPGYVETRSRGISADIDAVHMDGPTIDNPGETNDLRDEPDGAVPWHIN